MIERLILFCLTLLQSVACFAQWQADDSNIYYSGGE